MLSEKDLIAFGKDYKAGVPVAEIAERFGIRKSSVAALRSKLGLAPRRPRQARRLAEADAIEKAKAKLNGRAR